MALTPSVAGCASCGGGGGGGDSVDVESLVLCDVVDGEVVGTALAVYEYDATGNPSGPPTFVVPGTNDPYVAQGTLGACPGEVGCGAPQQFCFTASATNDVPGRMYDVTFSLGQGFAVTGIGQDLIFAPTNVLWSVNDGDASDFVEDLEAAIQSQFPGSTVDIAPGTDNRCVNGTQEFNIHIECLRLDQDPPSLVQIRYNAGRDLVLNPAFGEDPPLNPPVNQGNYGFHLLSRQDDPGPFPINQPSGQVNCTTVANRGWETNDQGRTFEIWGQDVQNSQNTTPTPRGTPVQEMASDGPPPGQRSTIWQTFTVPAAGNFNIRVVHGARDPGEEHIISLSTGDTGSNQVGDLINNVTNPPSVTSNGGPNPWTTFNQVINLPAGVYTLALSTTNPNGANRGGLFTDMRVFIDGPEETESFVNDDDTCTVEVTSSDTTCEFWAPRCSNGTITHWYNVADGEELTNAAFWAQVPAPQCCTSSGDSGGGDAVLGNLVHTYLVCGQTDTGPRTLSRVVYTDQNGAAISEQFVDTSGALVTPSSWQPGACPGGDSQPDREYEILCDDNGTFLRRYNVDQFANVTITDTLIDGTTAYAPVGTVIQCPVEVTNLDTEVVELCDVTAGGAVVPFLRVLTYDESGTLVSASDQDGNGNPYVPTGSVTVCSNTQLFEHILCDATGTAFIRRSVLNGGTLVDSGDFELDGLTPYAPLGAVGVCGGNDVDREVVCWTTTAGGATIFTGTIRHDDSLPAPGWILFDQNITPVLSTEPGLTFVPCSPPIVLDDPFGATEEIVCDSGAVPTVSFIRRTILDANGAATATVNVTVDGAPYAPVGPVVLGTCDECCPITLGSGCADEGAGVFATTSIRLGDGTIQILSQVDGHVVLPADVVACPTASAVTLNSQARLLTAGQSWTPGADVVGVLTGVSFTVITGTATLTDSNGTVSAGLPPGLTGEWQSEDGNSVVAPQSIAAVGGNTWVTWTQR